MAFGSTTPPRRKTHLDSLESRFSCSPQLDVADNDRSKLSANRACDIPQLPAASQPIVWTILCPSAVADYRGVFCYLRGYRALAATLVALAATCKVFPLLLFVFFLQRRDWRALTSGMITGVCTVAISIAVFGLNIHRTWLQEILPWVMHGEGLGTYTTTASISGILHCLFLSEPQWNPHPWHDSLLAYALLAPALQMLALAPAILLIRRDNDSDQRILLEWSALLTASLAISTIPASYNFVLMIFPVCVLASRLLQARNYGWLAALVVTYLGIGFLSRAKQTRRPRATAIRPAPAIDDGNTFRYLYNPMA